MALSINDLDALDMALVSGELSVEIDGRKITYRSVSEIQKSRRFLGRKLAAQAGKRSNPLAGIVTAVDRGIR